MSAEEKKEEKKEEKDGYDSSEQKVEVTIQYGSGCGYAAKFNCAKILLEDRFPDELTIVGKKDSDKTENFEIFVNATLIHSKKTKNNGFLNVDNATQEEIICNAIYYALNPSKSEEKKDIDPDLEQKAKDFVLSRKKHYSPEKEKNFRFANAKDIQMKRWKWYKNNTELFKLVLLNNGFLLEDIKCAANGTKPLGMTHNLFNDFKKETFISMNKAEQRIKKEVKQQLKLRIILQGSYIYGFSQNPIKGDKYVPNWLFIPTNKSDYDFRCYSDGLGAYVESLRKKLKPKYDKLMAQAKKLKSSGKGKEAKKKELEAEKKYVIHDRFTKYKDKKSKHLIIPASIGLIFPEFKELENKFAKLSEKHIGKKVKLQISLYTKNINFEANPWNMEVKQK